MSPAIRILLAVLLLTVGITVATLATGGSTAEAVTTRTWQSSKECRECHTEVYDEWFGSHHQISYTNPAVRDISDDFRNKECQACHLPRPVFETGLTNRTLPRLARPDEGVDCLTCHLAPDGGLFGRDSRPDVPCQPRASQEFVSVALCETCHNQHQTTDQWRASEWAAKGTSCNDCHMAERAGGGRHHGYPGAHDLAMLRRAGEFRATATDDVLTLSLTNVGAGHNFPTEERHRAVDIEYRFLAADGSEVVPATQAYRFRSPYRDEKGDDTQLPAGETVSVDVPIPAGAARAEARLWYRLSPYISNDESTLLFEELVELP